MSAPIIFGDTDSHVDNKNQDNKIPLHHGVQSRVNKMSSISGGLSTMSHGIMNNHGYKKTSLSHRRWSLHANSNEVPSSTIKMVGVSLTIKEEELSATPLEDKDNQGGTWVCISNGPQLVNEESTKIKKGWWKKSMQLSVSLSDGAKTKINVRKGLAQWTTSSHQQVNRTYLL